MHAGLLFESRKQDLLFAGEVGQHGLSEVRENLLGTTPFGAVDGVLRLREEIVAVFVIIGEVVRKLCHGMLH
jgi:hypothetical protein